MQVEQLSPEMFPTVGLVGEKTKILPFKESDITPAYISWLNDQAVVRYSNQRFRKHDEVSSRAYLSSFAGTRNLFLSIKKIDDESSIGTLTVYVATQHQTADIGILLGEMSIWGRGYGFDAWRTISDWLLEKCRMRKVTGGTIASNTAMKSIFERSGMQLDGIRKAQELVDEVPTDVIYYARFQHA